MNYKTTKKLLLELLGYSEDTKKIAFAMYTLEDGVKVEVDDETKEAFILDAEEMRIGPAEDGEYKLEDGRTILIEGGLLTKIKDAEDVDPAEAEEEAELAKEETANELEEMKAEFTKEKEEFENKIEELSKQIETISNTNKELLEKITKLSKEPVSEKVEVTPSSDANSNNENKVELPEKFKKAYELGSLARNRKNKK